MGADFARENVTEGIISVLKEAQGRDQETDELQEQNLRAIVGITKHSTSPSAPPSTVCMRARTRRVRRAWLTILSGRTYRGAVCRVH
jgi:hypothetical protein